MDPLRRFRAAVNAARLAVRLAPRTPGPLGPMVTSMPPGPLASADREARPLALLGGGGAAPTAAAAVPAAATSCGEQGCLVIRGVKPLEKLLVHFELETFETESGDYVALVNECGTVTYEYVEAGLTGNDVVLDWVGIHNLIIDDWIASYIISVVQRSRVVHHIRDDIAIISFQELCL